MVKRKPYKERSDKGQKRERYKAHRFNANQSVNERLIGMCAEFLCSNFSKFSQSNKIKISLEIFKRTIPNQNEWSQKKLTPEERQQRIDDLRKFGVIVG
jgi:hypothetical protein